LLNSRRIEDAVTAFFARMSIGTKWTASLLSALVLGAAGLAHGAEIYRWVDEQGRVHYGNSVPEAFRHKAKSVDTRGAEAGDAQRSEAEARLAKERAQLEALKQQRTKPPASPGRPPPSPVKSPPAAASRASVSRSACEEQWKRYRESQACFAPYRLAGGGIKAEAFKNCVEIPEPTC
jgi:hypothetical protein